MESDRTGQAIGQGGHSGPGLVPLGRDEARTPELHVRRPLGPENKMLQGLRENTVSGQRTVSSKGSTVGMTNSLTMRHPQTSQKS